ncbi:MAG: competence/damage-inducible protein A [Clostridia bacterium]|nr:competence/damage-inducible protein A [Clostridia bacterium]
MNAEIISVGTELLMGQILNTNARYISGRLADLGINLYYHITVGDNHDRLKDSIKTGFSRSDILIFTGGLGPTEDDLTKETIADYFGLELIIYEDYKEKLIERMVSRGYQCTPNNFKQVMFPKDHCIILPNPNGSAPGCIIEMDGKAAIMMPGPPWEMEPMFEAQVVPYLEKRSNCRFYSRTLRIFGRGESQVEHDIQDIVDLQTNPTIAPYAKAAETTLRITARCGDEAEGEELILPVMDEICDRIGEYVYSSHGKEMHEVCAELLSKNQLKLAVAESCTGGMIASQLVSVPGSSEWFIEGAVTYAPEAKMCRLGVKAETLDKYTDVSAETAMEMAEGIRISSGADIGISTTGYAGPSGAPDQVGHVFIGVSHRDGVQAYEFHFKGSRERVRITATLNALNLLRKLILSKGMYKPHCYMI